MASTSTIEPQLVQVDAANTVATTDGGGPASRFMPYHSPHHQPAKGRYITSNDPRGYIPVYEYPLNGQWIMMDMDDGYILWTGIWKALGNHKADIVKMLESQPELATQLRRVRGGYLKIQGTWLAYEVALCLARRVAWPIRHDLVPLFGPTFPTTCLAPDQPGYGTVIPPTGRRKPRRSLQSVGIPPPHSVPFTSSNNKQQQQQNDAGARVGPVLATHHEQHHHLRHHSTSSPVNHHPHQPPSGAANAPFAPPVIPPVPALVPTNGGVVAAAAANGVAYSMPEASQFTTSPSTYSPMRDYPPKVRYSPYTLPRRHHSPSATISGYGLPSPFGYEHQQPPRPLMHRASAPNLRTFHSRSHLSVPRLSVNTQLPAAAKDQINRPLLPMASAPETAEDGPSVVGGDESQHFGATEDFSGESYGASSGDSVRSSIHTPPFSEVGGPAYDQSWQVVPTPVDGAMRWPETPGEYSTGYESSHYFAEASASYSDPSCASPATAWSYDGYGRHSPSERHYQYHPPRPMHHHYSSISSTKSYDDRRMSMADSIASSFPEPDMHMSYHRLSQPHLHHPLPAPHLEMWMRGRSGSFAEASYTMQQVPYPEQQQQPEAVEPHALMGSQDQVTASPMSAHNPPISQHRRSASDASISADGQLPHYSPPNIHQEAVASW